MLCKRPEWGVAIFFLSGHFPVDFEIVLNTKLVATGRVWQGPVRRRWATQCTVPTPQYIWRFCRHTLHDDAVIGQRIFFALHNDMRTVNRTIDLPFYAASSMVHSNLNGTDNSDSIACDTTVHISVFVRKCALIWSDPTRCACSSCLRTFRL